MKRNLDINNFEIFNLLNIRIIILNLKLWFNNNNYFTIWFELFISIDNE